MLSRLSNIFKQEEKKSRLDLKDLLVQIKEFNSEERQLVIDECNKISTNELTVIPTTIISQPESSQPESLQLESSSVPTYQYKPQQYKRGND